MVPYFLDELCIAPGYICRPTPYSNLQVTFYDCCFAALYSQFYRAGQDIAPFSTVYSVAGILAAYLMYNTDCCIASLTCLKQALKSFKLHLAGLPQG